MGHVGKNHTGFERVCASCQARCDLFLPDNSTPISVCKTCWNALNIAQRLLITAQMRQTKELTDLVSMISEAVRHGSLVDSRARKNEGN